VLTCGEQDAESSGGGQSAALRFDAASALVDQQQFGVLLLGELDGFAFARVEGSE
jgi:hypothetical protein